MKFNMQSVRENYSHPSLVKTIVDALKRAGKDLDNLSPDDLVAVDEFHTRGRAATTELARLAGIGPAENVLDLGSGLGGPARFLAKHYGCRVTGIDLTPDFVAVAEELTRLTRLTGQVSFREGNALAIPFAASAFDVVWSQNVAMNIGDRPGLYAEIRRVLRPHGKYALSDIVRGPGGEPRYPVPWALDESASFLLTEMETRAALERAGFHIVAWENTTPQAISAAAERTAATSLPPLGLHLVFGAAWPVIMANMLQNYRDQSIAVIQGVVVRRD